MELRKVFKVGNSCGISLPPNMLEALGVKTGSHFSVEINREMRELILKPVVVKNNTMSVDFVRIVNKVMLDYETALRRLSI